MGDRQRGFAEHQALGRLHEIDAAAVGLAGEDEMVVRRGVAAERELQPALAREGAVAGAAVAAEAGEYRRDVVAVAPGEWIAGASDCHLEGGFLLAAKGGDGRLAIADGMQDAVGVHGRHLVVGGDELSPLGHVAVHDAVGGGDDKEALAGVRPGEGDVAGEHPQLGAGGGGQRETGDGGEQAISHGCSLIHDFARNRKRRQSAVAGLTLLCPTAPGTCCLGPHAPPQNNS